MNKYRKCMFFTFLSPCRVPLRRSDNNCELSLFFMDFCDFSIFSKTIVTTTVGFVNIFVCIKIYFLRFSKNHSHVLEIKIKKYIFLYFPENHKMKLHCNGENMKKNRKITKTQNFDHKKGTVF